MPLPACFQLADNVFPRVRAEAARRLTAQGWSQARAAQTLDVSQAMVSKYIGAKDPETDSLVLRLTDELLHDMASPADGDGPSAWCNTLAPRDERPGATEALHDLLAAEQELTRDPPNHLIPQIGLNVARAVDGAKAPRDVLAFPGRLVAVGDRLVSPAPPAWGGSEHLANCLIALRSSEPGIYAMANIRGAPEAVEALSTSETVARVDRSERFDDAPVLKRFQQGHRFVHDPGAIGIEPCLYVTGASATEVTQIIHSIQHRLTQ